MCEHARPPDAADALLRLALPVDDAETVGGRARAPLALHALPLLWLRVSGVAAALTLMGTLYGLTEFAKFWYIHSVLIASVVSVQGWR